MLTRHLLAFHPGPVSPAQPSLSFLLTEILYFLENKIRKMRLLRVPPLRSPCAHSDSSRLSSATARTLPGTLCCAQSLILPPFRPQTDLTRSPLATYHLPSEPASLTETRIQCRPSPLRPRTHSPRLLSYNTCCIPPNSLPPAHFLPPSAFRRHALSLMPKDDSAPRDVHATRRVCRTIALDAHPRLGRPPSRDRFCQTPSIVGFPTRFDASHSMSRGRSTTTATLKP